MRVNSNIPGPLLADLRRRFRLNFFVETGAAGGDTTELAAGYFDHVFSCEIDGQLFRAAKRRLAGYGNVDLYRMLSPEFIRKVKPQVCQPAMWWLDAHWCGGPVKPEKECPLLEELAEVKGTHGHSVVLIDDVQLMIHPPPPPHDPNQWPTLDEVKNAVASWGESIQTEVVRGPNSLILVITPAAA